MTDSDEELALVALPRRALATAAGYIACWAEEGRGEPHEVAEILAAFAAARPPATPAEIQVAALATVPKLSRRDASLIARTLAKRVGPLPSSVEPPGPPDETLTAAAADMNRVAAERARKLYDEALRSLLRPERFMATPRVLAALDGLGYNAPSTALGYALPCWDAEARTRMGLPGRPVRGR